MKKVLLALLIAALASPLAAETWKSVALMDAGCASKSAALEHPENHQTSCALRCAKNGYGVVVDGKFIKFDEKGSELAVEALKKTEKKDHLTATVSGELKDGVIAVTELTLD